MKLPAPVVLASGSPQRRELLKRVVRDFETVEPQVDEGACRAEGPAERALELARAKAHDVARRRPAAIVIAADTIVECDGEIIGKPADRDDAIRILEKLTRRPHCVMTGLCVVAPGGREFADTKLTRMRMRQMSRGEIEDYVDREDVLGRAGAYGLQERDPNVLSLEGSSSSVMGLPLELLTAILQSLSEESSAPTDRRRAGKGTMSVGDFFWLVEDRIGGMAHPGRDAGTFARLKGMGIGALVSLTVVGLPGRLLKGHGLDYLHLPIEDYTPPRQEQIDEFIGFCERNISQGRPVAVHCLAGRGRTGTMLACYLVRQGMKADEAIERVRAVRPGAIETFEQEVAIHDYAARTQGQAADDEHK